MADSDKKRKESDMDPSASIERTQKRKPASTLEAVRSWVGFSSSNLQTKNEEDGNRNNNNYNNILHAMEDLKQVTEEQVKVSREADKMRRIEFALQSLVGKDWSSTGITSDFQPRKAKGHHHGPFGQTYNHEVTCVDYGKTLSFLRNILWSFRLGEGHTLQKKEYIVLPEEVRQRSCVAKIEEEWYENFQKALIRKLHMLLGKEPRCECSSDGETMTLFYE